MKLLKFKYERDTTTPAEYSQWLLKRIIGVFCIGFIIAVPLVQYFMIKFEDRYITIGQSAVFVMQTLTTTGYGELLPFKSAVMSVTALLLMIGGVVFVFIFAGTLMTTLIERSIAPKAPTSVDISDHIVVTDYNVNTVKIVEFFKKNDIPYIVSAITQEKALHLRDKKIRAINANPKIKEGIVALNVEKAKLVIVSDEDTRAVGVILNVAKNTDTKVIAIMESEVKAKLAYDAGANNVIIIEEKLGNQLVDWICADTIPTDFLNLLDVSISPSTLKQLSPSILHTGDQDLYEDKTIGDLNLRAKTGASIVGVWKSDGTVEKPTADTKVAGSTLIVVGLHDSVSKLVKLMGGPGVGNKVILVGAGRTGQKVGVRLNQSGVIPTVIDVEEKPLWFDGNLIVGDSTSHEILEKAGIDKAETLITTLNDDSMNIFVCLASNHINPNINIVSRAISKEAISLLHQAGCQHVLSEAFFSFQFLQVEMVKMGLLPKSPDVTVREVYWNKESITLKEIIEQIEGDNHFVCIVKNEVAIAPSLDIVIERGDSFVVIAENPFMMPFGKV